MTISHYIGFDVHKKSVSYCVKTADGTIVEEARLAATRESLRQWAEKRREPWHGAMEATLFSGWIYDVLKPYAGELPMGHPAMMKASGASKKKNDRLDARKTADLVRCNLLPVCYVAPTEIRELRRMLRYRNLVVGQAVQMKNRMSGLLMEVGAQYNKKQLHGKQYFSELLGQLEEVPESVKELLRLSRGALELFQATQEQIHVRLQKHPQLSKRVELLKSIRGVGEVTSLTWALEVGEPKRFPSIDHAVSYCGFTSALDESAEKQRRGPLSKQRNAHLQAVLTEAAKVAPRWNPQLAAIHDRELHRGHRNRATLEVARRLVAYLLAVDKSGKPFEIRHPPAGETEEAKVV
ncbi:MAG: IS110 family transposase [Bryobacteraceae bacterium]